MIIVFAMAVTGQHAQHALLVGQEHRSGLHIHQPSHLAHDLSHDGVRVKRPDYSVRGFEQRAQLAKFFQPVELQAYERACQVTNLVITTREHGSMYRD